MAESRQEVQELKAKLEQVLTEYRSAHGMSVKPGTIKTYVQSASMLIRSVGAEGWEKRRWATKHEKAIEAYIDGLSNDATRKTALQSIIQVGTAVPAAARVLKTWNIKFRQLMADLQEKAKEQKATTKQQQNWVSLSELRRVVRGYEHTLKEAGVLNGRGVLPRHLQPVMLKWVVGSLYVLDDANPPQRLVYRDTRVISRQAYAALSEQDKGEHNYLVRISPKTKFMFSIGDHKTSGKYGVLKIPVGSKLARVLKIWLEYHSGDYLLSSSPLLQPAMSKLVTETFAPTGKRIGASMIRHIVLTTLFPTEEVKARAQVAHAMGHSLETQAKYSLDLTDAGAAKSGSP
jgi:hypothetical protein